MSGGGFTTGPHRWCLQVTEGNMQGLGLVIPDWSEPEGQLGDLIWLKRRKRDEVRDTVRKMAQSRDSTSYHVRWGEDRWERYSQHTENRWWLQ